MGAPSYDNKAQLTICADGITVQDPTATVIISPNEGYVVDTTPLMSNIGACDTDADYSRTQPVLAGSGTIGNSNGEHLTTLSTIVSSAIASASAQSGVGGNHVGTESCSWTGHCQGAPCQNDEDCFDPFSCVNSICT